MIIDRAYSGKTPETHLLIEVTPTVLREIASRLEERSKITSKDRVLTIPLTKEVTLAFQVEGDTSAFQIKIPTEEVWRVAEIGKNIGEASLGVQQEHAEELTGQS